MDRAATQQESPFPGDDGPHDHLRILVADESAFRTNQPRQGVAVGNRADPGPAGRALRFGGGRRSEEHTSELQSLMRISYAVFCLKKNKKYKAQKPNNKE